MSIIESNVYSREEVVLSNFDQGWNYEFAEQLVTNSQQHHIAEMASEDLSNFSSVKNAKRWFDSQIGENDHLFLWLGSSAGRLAGLAWISGLNGSTITTEFGVRVYRGFEGQGVATRLGQEVHRRYDNMNTGRPIIFKTPTGNNAAFVLTTLKLGYNIRHSAPESSLPLRLRPQAYTRIKS